MRALSVNFLRGLSVDRLASRLALWRCVVCDGPGVGMDLCPACFDALPWLGPGAPPPPFKCTAALAYAPPVDRLITALKFHGRLAHGRVLGELLSIVLREQARAGVLSAVDCVLPVPLGRMRQRQRGYNQAGIIAAVVCRELGLQPETHSLYRCRATKAQMTLARSDRTANLRGAFAVREAVSGRRVALVDDVLTTGATLSACTEVLLNAGAIAVENWVVARTLPLR